MADNNEIGKAWAAGKAAHAANFSTDGNDIYSYQLKIGHTYGGKKIAIDYTKSGGQYFSQTTSKHVSIAKRNADKVIPPK